ncbi:MAG: membrane protein insertase YidC [Hyphomicrobiaceae bacterium]
MQQSPDNQKNLLTAIVLSVLVLLAWNYFYAGPKMQQEQERKKQEQARSAPTTPQPGAPGVAPQPGAPQATPQPGVPRPSPSPAGSVPRPSGPVLASISRDAALKAAPRAVLETPNLMGSVSLKGGRIDDLVLRAYHETVSPKSPKVVMFSPPASPSPYYAEFGWIPAPGIAAKLPTQDTVWKQVDPKARLTDKTPLELVWDNGAGLVFKRTISVDDSYMFKVVDTVENKTGQELRLQHYGLIRMDGTPKIQGFFILHEGLLGVLGKDGLQEITFSDAADKKGIDKSFKGVTGGWLGITEKYWASVLIPPQKTSYEGQLHGSPKAGARREVFQAVYLRDVLVVPAGGTAQSEGQLFAGAKQLAIVDGYEKKYGIEKFNLLIDWGWFFFITKPLFRLLEWLYGIFGNFGIAILVATVLVKLAFFPLANKSYESMSKMKKLQPEMERIRDRFKDDKVRMQQAMMELYQKEKINPMAGCLPILLQIPVFFALYKVLFVTIDMRHAPFFGWIRDLSAPDPTSLFNLFGLLPYNVPEFLHIGVWPIIMGVTMWFQMQLNPQQPDPIQQKIFNWMPVMFTFLLASFPAGLVIYWTWNNILSIAQQSLIMKKQGVDIPLAENLSKSLGWLSRLRGGGPKDGPGSKKNPAE